MYVDFPFPRQTDYQTYYHGQLCIIYLEANEHLYNHTIPIGQATDPQPVQTASGSHRNQIYLYIQDKYLAISSISACVLYLNPGSFT